jgi:hypothetical protein
MIDRLPASPPAGGGPVPLLAGAPRCTPWQDFDTLWLVAGASLESGDDTETVYVLVDGEIDAEQAGERVTALGPAALRCAAGAPHRLTSSTGARLVRATVASSSQGGQLAVDAFAADRLPWRDAIHGGGGRIGTRHLWRPDEFVSGWTFVDHAVLSKGSSLGLHYHDHLDEAFLVLAGRGWMTIGDETVDVGPGDATWHAEGVGHGIYNPFDEDLDFVRLAVAVPGAAYTTIDLDDDLTGRRPTES